MAWAEPLLRNASPIMNPPVAVTMASRPILSFVIRMFVVPPFGIACAYVADQWPATCPVHVRQLRGLCSPALRTGHLIVWKALQTTSTAIAWRATCA